MIVAYNPTLLKRYNSHINVEFCRNIGSIKYLYQYLHKGFDRALIKVGQENQEDEIYDEINNYLNMRYIGPTEAAWRILELPMSGRSHAVQRLAIHTQNQQNIIFEEFKEDEIIDKNNNTTLTAWFELNKNDKEARNIKYENIPKFYSFNNQEKKWHKRIKTCKTIGRLSNVSPKDIERFHLKLILNFVSGATSFDDLKNYQGNSYSTFQETANAMGLIESDEHLCNIFDEACQIMMPKELRQFFSWFLIGDKMATTYSLLIWNKYKNQFGEDFKTDKDNSTLLEIEKILKSENFSCKTFGLPQPVVKNEIKINDENYQELSIKYASMLNYE